MPLPLRVQIPCALFSAFVLLGFCPGTTAFAQRTTLREAKPPVEVAQGKQEPVAPAKRSAQGFSVAEFTPQGPAGADAVISVAFTEAVVSQDAVDSTTTAAADMPTALFTFDPPLEGSVRWKSPSEAVFEPAVPLRRATAYTVRINPLLQSLAGNKLARGAEYHFQTPALAFEGARQTRFTENREAVLSLRFSDRVTPAGLKKHVKLLAGGMPVQWKPASQTASSSPQIITGRLTTSALTLIIEPGLRGAEGPLGIADRIEKEIQMTFSLVPVALEGEWDQGVPQFKIRFSHETWGMNPDKLVAFEPPVGQLRFHTESDSILVARGDFKAQTRYTAIIGEGLKNNQNVVTMTTSSLSAYMPALAPFIHVQEKNGYLSTNSRMRLPLTAAGVDKITVSVRRIMDNNLSFLALSQNPLNSGSEYYDGDPAERFGEHVAEKTYAVPPSPGQALECDIDLRDLLGEGASGFYSLSLRAHTPTPDLLQHDGTYWGRRRAQEALQSSAFIALSNLGIVAKKGTGEVTVYVGALDTAKPMPGINVSVYSNKNKLLGTATTDANGFARVTGIPAPREYDDGMPAVVVAQASDNSQVSMLNLEDALSGLEQFASSGRNFLAEGYEAFITPERGVYRPGETVHFTGFVRDRDASAPDAAFPLELILGRPDGKEMTPVIQMTTGSGLIAWDFKVPDYAPTGKWNLDVRIPGADTKAVPDPDGYDDTNRRTIGNSEFSVEEFIPNRVKIDTVAEDRRFNTSAPLTAAVSAEEMFGQPLAGRPVSGQVSWRAVPFAPKQWAGFTFGDRELKFAPQHLGLPENVLGPDGKTSVTAVPPRMRPPAALEARLQTTVLDGGRGVTREIKRTVDPVPYYLGIKSTKDTYPAPGELTELQVVAVNPTGDLHPVDTVLTGTISRVKWNSSLTRNHDGSVHFKTHRELIDPMPTSVTLTAGRGVIQWTPISTGDYLVRLGNLANRPPADPKAPVLPSVSDNFYVSSHDWDHQPWSLEKPETAELVLDRDNYLSSDTARLIIKAPFPGTVLLTLEQDRVLSSTILHMTENTIEVPVALDDSMLPNVYAVASIIRPVTAAQQWLPHRAVGMVNIPLTAPARSIDIELSSPDEVRPGSDLTINANLRDHTTSAPVAGDVIIWAVDEGILTLTDFQTPSPGDFFAAARRLMVETSDFFSRLMPDLITGAKTLARIGGDAMDSAGRFSPVPGDRIKPVILWQGPLVAGPDGRATVTYKVPEFMGRLRIMAMAADSQRFGSAETTTFVRSPVMVKEYLPRFAAPGDRFTAGFTVYNNTDAPVAPQLSVSSDGLLSLPDAPHSEQLQAIPARGQSTVYRTVMADSGRVGSAAIRADASAQAESFGTSVSIPVRPASPRLRQSDSQSATPGASARFQIPGGYLPGTTSATLVVGGSPAIDLAGAFRYNAAYPYGCTEQVVSAAFPLLKLQDLAQATDPVQYSPDGIRTAVQAAIDKIFMTQTNDGGLAMWPGSYDSKEWVSAYAAHFLVEAENAGYRVHPDYKRQLLDYLTETLGADQSDATAEEARQKAYQAYVLLRSGRKIHQRLAGLNAISSRLGAEGRALLASAYLEADLPQEAVRLLQMNSGFDDTTSQSQTGGILSSPARETAILLMTWLKTEPQSPRVNDLAQRLMALRKDDQWGSTQANAFALLALAEYNATKKDEEPVSGTVTFAGETYPFSTSAPLTLAQPELAGATITVNATQGTAYAWYLSEGVPLQPPRQAQSNGLYIKRRLLNRDEKPLNPANIIEGELVIVELAIGGRRDLENVVLQDLLPAGLEIENPRLASSESIEGGDESSAISVQRVDVRDDRILVFGDLFRPDYDSDGSESDLEDSDESVQTYRYTARAVTPGEFTLPPASIEAMYDPSISARTETGRLKIARRNR